MSTHRFDYVASTALYSEICSQQRSYFSVLEQVAQASRLQQQLRLFLQDEENPSFNNSLTSANFHVITQKIGNFFPTVSFVYFWLLPTHSSTSFWPFGHSSPMFEPYVYPILLCAICVTVYALWPKLFGFGQPHVLPATSTHHTSFLTPDIPGESWLSNYYSLSRVVLVSLYLSPRLLNRNRWMKPKRFANLTSVSSTCCIFSLPIIALLLKSSYKCNKRIRMYLQL